MFKLPKWGLTLAQRETRPWGLDPEWLEPSKTITEPVHEDIYLTRIERRLLDSKPMQRLRRVRQLGTTDLVYPGATHSRFAHSIGTLRAAQDLMDAVVAQGSGAKPKRDLFAEWQAEGEAEASRRLAEATVLARLGGLLHDLGHIPFGHSVEDDLGILKSHDANTDRFEYLWTGLPSDVQAAIQDPLKAALTRIIVAKADGVPALPDQYTFVADIVGNTICADLLDYLARDHLYTGLPAKFGHRFLDGFYVTPSDDIYYPRRMAIRIARGARTRADVISELFKFLRYRYELSERALVHHAKLSADAMVGKALEIWYDAIRADLVVGGAGEVDRDIDTILKGQDLADVDRRARDVLEGQMLARGDDGLLEYLRDLPESRPGNRRIGAASTLAASILDRRLYKPIGSTTAETRAMATQIHGKFGSFEARRRLEQRCARYAGLEHRWHVLLWIPAPKMRMKAAMVLVDDGNRVQHLEDYDRAAGRRGAEIYDSHVALWTLSVYVHESVTELQKEVILAWLADELEVTWAQPNPSVRLPAIAAREAARASNLSRDEEAGLTVAMAAKSGVESFAALLDAARVAAQPPIRTKGPARSAAKPAAKQADLGLDRKPRD